MATIPEPQENDADDVSLALEVAQSQWTRGDRAEALKWLRKAVDAAFEADDNPRGIELSKFAAELKASLEPKLPPPRRSAVPLQSEPLKPSAPPNRPSEQAEPSTPPKRNLVERERTTSSVQPKPSLEEDEQTHEYQLTDALPYAVPYAAPDAAPDAVPDAVPSARANVPDGWPGEAFDSMAEIIDPPDQTGARKAMQLKDTAKPRSRHRKGSRPADRASGSKQKRPQIAVPSTRAVRVAVGKTKNSVYVRLLDSQGLREGEHDAMLVALTGDGDIRTLFSTG